MNTTAFGNTLEEKIFDLIDSEIFHDRFWAKKECCRLHRQKGYYSKDREKDIIFDVSIEIYLPGADDYSVLILIECKNYSHSVPVDDAEEFYAKVQQVTGANCKAVIATTNSFQAGALKYAKSKGIGLLRYFNKDNFKWELNRSPSAGARSTDVDDARRIEHALLQQEYQSNYFDFYGQSSRRLTNALWDFFEDFISDSNLTEQEQHSISNPRNKLASRINFIEKDQIESLAESTLTSIRYTEGEVSLDAICNYELEHSGLKVTLDIAQDSAKIENVLGKITFDPLEINLYSQVTPHYGRMRFTLAHELGHHLLGHSNYMKTEYFQQSDLEFDWLSNIDSSDIARLEWQANYFASCLLLPRRNFMHSCYEQLTRSEIVNKGFGALYVDKQPENIENYYTITNFLKAKYGVSRSVVKIRLENLGLLRDDRPKFTDGHISSIMPHIGS